MFRSVAFAMAATLMLVTADAVAGGSAGVSLGGSWMTQSQEWSSDFPVSDLADEGVLSFAAGLFFRIELPRSFSAGVEAIYTQKGFESKSTSTNAMGEVTGTITTRYSGHYLSVPATIGYGYGFGGSTLHFFGGLSAEILLSHDDDEVFSYMNPVVLGGHVGVGFEWNRLGANVRYVSDLTESFDPEPDFNLRSVRSYGIVALATFAIWL